MSAKTYYPGLAKACREALAEVWDELVICAREHGYAFALHGSVARDIDVIAVPWPAHHISRPLTLIRALRRTLKATRPDGLAFIANIEPEQKPHGRLAWTIHLGGGPYLDISVMPAAEYADRVGDDDASEDLND